MKKSDFRGTGKIFKFTLIQYFKNKSTIITLAIFLIISLLSVPLYTAISGNICTNTDSLPVIENLYFNNRTDFTFDSLKESLEGINIIPCSEEPGDNISQSVYIDVSVDNGTSVNAVSLDPENSFDFELSNISYMLNTEIQKEKLKLAGASDEQIELIYAESYAGTYDYDEYVGTAEENDTDSYFLVSYVLSILIMILTMFSSISIIQAVVEEKSSKLMELLLISVEPLALILGKILAVMVYMLAEFILIGASFFVSSAISNLIFHSSVASILTGAGFGELIASLNIKDVLIFLVSVILGYMTFSILGGLSGARCHTTEEAGEANLSVMLIVIFSYLVAVVQSGIDSYAFSLFAALCPMLSIFCAPASFICGRISFWVMLVSWILQAGVIVLLARFTAKVYKDLIVYNGSKVKLKMLFKMAKGGEKA